MPDHSSSRHHTLPVWLNRLAVLLTLTAVVYGGSSQAATDSQNVHLRSYCAADANLGHLPTAAQWHGQPGSTVVVGVDEPCWVSVEVSHNVGEGDNARALMLSESLAMDIQAFDWTGRPVARSAPGISSEHAISAGRMVLLEPVSTSKTPILLHLQVDPRATEYKQMETSVQWVAVDAVLPPVLREMSASLLAVGALAFAIVLSCALAFALRRPLFALGGAASLINIQVLLAGTGGYRVLDLPASIFTYESPLLLACFGMLLLFITEFCSFRQHCRKTALALLGFSGLFFCAAVCLLAYPDAFTAFDLYEWLRLPAYVLILYGLIQGLRLKQIPAAMCLAALAPDYVYLFYYVMPQLHWALGDTVMVKLPDFAQSGSVFELVVILWLPFMLCLALVHQVLTVERARTRAALTDALTGLPNRAGLHVALRHLSGDFTVLVIDLNRFKSIDLALGRALGDEVLQGFAKRLLRLQHATVARLHSDRFAVVLGQRFVTADLVAQMDTVLDEPLQVQGQVVDLSATIGISSNTADVDLEKQMRQAEMALHHARQRHIAALRYDPSLEQSSPNDLSLMSDLHHAVANQELRLYLQPKVRLQDGSVPAAEGLVRWLHPHRGMVPPSEFVNFAEQLGRIGFITQWVLQQAMQIAAQQRHEGKPIQISVNISAVDLANEDFVNLVSELAEQTGAEPCDIKLEITESAAMEEPEQALVAMQRLHDLGFKWSLDDFGTGYSSLSYLQRMPLSELKIDRVFVRNVTPDSDAAKLLGSVITLGHQLGLTVVAEGAETQSEWDLLKALGSDMVQGWFAAKAMPLQEFLQWRESHPRFGI